MAYEPNNWSVGDVITAEKMNNIEQGIVDASQSGGGFDAEIKIYHSSNSGDDYECTILSGTYASLYEMLQNSTMPSVLIRIYDGMNSVRSATTNVCFYGWDENGITIHFLALKNASTTYSNDWQSYTFLIWTNENELYFD